MSNSTSRITEISTLILAVLLIVAGAVLLYLGKIGWDVAIFFVATAVGLYGYHAALKAPSPAQAQQLNAQLEQLNTQQQQIASVQALATQAVSAMQPLQEQAHTHSQAPGQQQPVTPQSQFIQPVTANQSAQYVQPMPPPVVDYGRRWGDSEQIASIQTQKIPTPS